MKKKILIFDFKQGEKTFFDKNQFKDYEIVFYKKRLNEMTIKEIPVKDKENAEIVSVFITSSIEKTVLEEFKNLKLIATRSTGYNHINLDECKKRNIAVANVSAYGETTVAQYTIGLLISLVRKIIPAYMDMKKFDNKSEEYIGKDLNTITLGVIGTGAIGRRVCKAANDFEMNILAYDLKENPEVIEKYGVEYVDLETLLKKSDVVSVHVPYFKSNYHLISEKELNLMKKTAYLINTSRGELVDTKALYQALVDKKIQGCALDVGECESFSFDMDNFMEKIPDTSANCLARALITQKLIELDNVIVTPHIAYNTEEAIETILETTFKNIKDFYSGIKSNRIEAE